MSSYAKLVKTCQDFALGLQSVNGAKTNLEFFRDAWTAEHGKEEPPSGAQTGVGDNPYEAFGRHDTPPIPRAIVAVTALTFGPGLSAFTVNAQPTVVGVTKLAVGQYRIDVDEHIDSYWGAAWPAQTSALIRFCKPVSYYPAAPGSPCSIVVSCYNQASAGAAFALTDFSFVLAIYGYTAAQAAATATAAASASSAKLPARPPPTPRTRMFGKIG